MKLLALALLLTAAHASAKAFDVTAYGAKGDGKTDDSQAIAAAVDAAAERGGTVYLPAGRYRANVVLRSNIILAGDGIGATVLIAKPSDGKTSSYTIFAKQVQNVVVRDLAVEADGAKTWWPAGIRFAGSSGVKIIGVLVTGSTHGQGIVFDEQPGPGSDNLVEGSTVKDCNQGIVADNENVRIIGNFVENCNYNISLEYATPHAAVVEGNVVDGKGRPKSFGVVGTAADHAVIANNNIRNVWQGVYLKEKSSRVSVTGNLIFDVSGFGILIEHSSSVTAQGNTVDHAKEGCIHLDDAAKSLVAHNALSNCGGLEVSGN